ncbi:MAG TPA: amidohydrolase family protein [Planctomycetaceae bacterium]|jgi:cytosine/adenosine deaminase-related metal-dependent hydrolase|nr:amidohydrolase family protein [Planctomycetaceae bacterium]
MTDKVDAQTFRPQPGTPFTVRARWIFPVADDPLPGGAVEVAADGRVLCVHRQSPTGARDLGDVALIPGLINAHTHLEFSELTKPLEPSRPFSDWLRALLGYRRSRGDARRAIQAGLAESQRCGTIALGDIDTRGQPDQYADGRSTQVTAFRELLGLDPATVALQLGTAAEFLDHPRGADETGGTVVRSLSPHAPYSVHPRLLDGIISLAATRQRPVAIHLAESRAELELLASGTGELVDLLTEAGIWQGALYPSGTTPLDFLRRLESLPRVVIAHGNYFNETELDFLARHPNLAVAFCPRTHAFFGHRNHPWRELAARGGVVALGTDGRCSNPDLSIWHELQFLRGQFPDYSAAGLLRMGTINGARALGRVDRLGTIEPHKSPGLAVIRLGRVGAPDAYDELLHPDSEVVNLIAG